MTEYVEGEELFDIITKNLFLKENKAKILFKKILTGVYHTHKNNIIHRDIKADNIICNERNGTIKLIDFGFGVDSQVNKKIKGVVGTPFYMAPELFNQQS